MSKPPMSPPPPVPPSARYSNDYVREVKVILMVAAAVISIFGSAIWFAAQELERQESNAIPSESVQRICADGRTFIYEVDGHSYWITGSTDGVKGSPLPEGIRPEHFCS